MPRVFLSHSTQDRRFVETTLLPTLQQHGIDTWYAPTEIHTAEEWERMIVKGLKSCDWFLVVLSENASQSKWVRAEVHWAIDNREGRLIPLLLRSCDPDEIHLRLRTIQYLDFCTDPSSAGDALLRIWGKRPRENRGSQPVTEPQGSSEKRFQVDVPGEWYQLAAGVHAALGGEKVFASLRRQQAEVNRSVRDLNLGWEMVCETPAQIEARPGAFYRLTVDSDVRDVGLKGLAHLCGLTGLKCLDLGWCDRITDAGLAHLRGLTALQSLRLTLCDRITDGGLAHLRGLTALEELDLGDCEEITDAGMAHLSGLNALQDLDLSECEQITDAGLAYLRGLTALEELHLGSCEKITDTGLAHLRGLTALRFFNLTGLNQITDAGLAHLRGFPALRWLWMGGCSGLTDAGVARLRKALPKCEIQHCAGAYLP